MNINISFRCSTDIEQYYEVAKEAISKLDASSRPELEYTDGIGGHPTICIHIKNININKVFNIFKDIDMDLCDVCKLTFVCDTYQNASKIRDKFQWAYEDILDSAIIEEYPPGAKPIAVYILRMIILCDNNKSIKWKDLLYYEE